MNTYQILATNPGCGKTHVLINLFLRDPHKCKYYLVPQNKNVVEIKSKLEALGIVNPKVMTIRSFLKNFRKITINDEVRYIPTAKSSKRAATKRVIDVFVDEVSMASKAEMGILISNFKIRNLFVAGDANQFLPIAQHCSISEIGSSEDFEVYEDKGELFDYQYDKTFLLTKSMRAENDLLKQWIYRIKNNLSIYPILDCCLDSVEKITADFQHIAYTNNKCNEINGALDKAETRQYIVKHSDKVFGLLKGQIYSSDSYQFRSKCISKKSYFIEQEKLGESPITAEEAYEDWFGYTFGLAYAVTCHKLQGSTIKDKPIMIHISDIMKCIEANKDNPTEYEKWLDNFHRFIYIAISRATSDEQIYIHADKYVISHLGDLRKYCKAINAFKDVKYNNTIETDSENFDYDQICFYDEDEIAEIEYAKSHTYKEYKQTYNKCKNRFLSLRKTEVPKNVYIKDTKIGTLDNNTNKDNLYSYSSAYSIQKSVLNSQIDEDDDPLGFKQVWKDTFGMSDEEADAFSKHLREENRKHPVTW